MIVPTINWLNANDAENANADLTKLQRRMLWATATKALIALTRAAYYRVDIHQAGLDVEEMPQVRLYAPSDDERATACLFGLPAVIERPLEPSTGSDLVRAWRQQGGENFSIYVGQSGSLQTQHCETLFKALLSFLDRTGVVSGLQPDTEDDELRYFDQRQFFVVLSKQSGIFSSNLKIGQWVRAGAELGRIYDSFTGSGSTRLIAPVTGLLASLRRQPLMCKGELLARILVPVRSTGRDVAAAGGWTWPMRRS
jgi:predicted deacylase